MIILAIAISNQACPVGCVNFSAAGTAQRLPCRTIPAAAAHAAAGRCQGAGPTLAGELGQRGLAAAETEVALHHLSDVACLQRLMLPNVNLLSVRDTRHRFYFKT